MTRAGDRAGPGAEAGGIERVAVLGAGTMGHGIAQLMAVAGCRVRLRDVEDRFLQAGLEKVRWSLGKLVEKGGMTRESAELALGRLEPTTDLTLAVSDADLVVEAVPEVLQIKKEIFAEVDRHAPSAAVLASNTSSMPIDELAASTTRPQSVVGMHFFNPPQLMPLVEVVRGTQTSDRVVDAILALSKRLGKETIVCNRYVPGFVVNNVLHSLEEAAMVMLQHGDASAEEMDSALKFRAGFPMGLFELADYSGIDVAYGVQRLFQDRGGEAAGSGVLKKMVDQGRLGAKSGSGFYEWRDGQRPKISQEAGRKVDITPIIAAGASGAADLMGMGVATKEDIDKGVKLGLGFSTGVLEAADEMGLDALLDSLTSFYATHGLSLSPSPTLVGLVKAGRLGKKTGGGFYDYGGRSTAGTYKTILVEVDPKTGLASLTLNRPQRLNTVTPEMLDEVSAAVDRLAEDERVRVLVVRGAGERAFSAGADVSTFQGDSPSSIVEGSKKGQRAFGKIEGFPKPVVAAIRGYCLGGGCELSLCCDFRVATTTAQIGQTEIALGIIPGWGGTQRMTRLIGEARAKELIMLGDKISGEEALRVGLVNRAVSPETFDREVTEFALRLAAGPPVALKLAKRAIAAASGAGEEDHGLDVEARAFGEAVQTEDATEGISSFLSKKRPDFKGR